MSRIAVADLGFLENVGHVGQNILFGARKFGLQLLLWPCLLDLILLALLGLLALSALLTLSADSALPFLTQLAVYFDKRLNHQQMPFILHATQNVGNYWIRANPNVGAQGFDGGINSAILRYKGAPCEEPTSKQINSTSPLLETDLHPLYNPRAPGKPFPGGADININLASEFNLTSFLYTVNNKTFVPPTLPVLTQILSGARSAQELLPPGSVYTLPRNKVVELTLPGGAIGGPVSSS